MSGDAQLATAASAVLGTTTVATTSAKTSQRMADRSAMRPRFSKFDSILVVTLLRRPYALRRRIRTPSAHARSETTPSKALAGSGTTRTESRPKVNDDEFAKPAGRSTATWKNVALLIVDKY